MREGLKGADVVMMLRLQLERMSGAYVPPSANITASSALTATSSSSPSRARW